VDKTTADPMYGVRRGVFQKHFLKGSRRP